MSKDSEKLMSMIYHTDGRVNAMESKLDDQGKQLSRIENAVLNKPPIWNMGSVLTLALAVGGFCVGITGYVSMQLTPMAAAISEVKHEQELRRNVDREHDKAISKWYTP